jgi:hypothetical protein
MPPKRSNATVFKQNSGVVDVSWRPTSSIVCVRQCRLGPRSHDVCVVNVGVSQLCVNVWVSPLRVNDVCVVNVWVSQLWMMKVCVVKCPR